MRSSTSSLATLALLAASASAHLFISSPMPIAGSGIKDPLDPSGSNFPCHGVALPGSGGAPMAVGSSQSLRFEGGGGANTAAHGGGSCQLSLTYETDPVKIKDPNNWKVIYSIEGGCPTNSPLNLNGNFPGPQGGYTGAYQCDDPKTNGYDCLNFFTFSIPQGVKNGQATLGWTWFNNVGNREMYMNCAAVEISGGSNDASGMSNFPSLFVANLASINGGTCRTTEQNNVGFPNPGQYRMQKKASSNMAVPTAKDYPIVTPTGCGVAQSYPTNAPANPPPAADPPATSPAPSSPAPTAPAGPVVTSAPTTAPTSTLTTSTTPVPGTSTVRKGASPKQPAATPGSCASGSVPCAGGVNSIICVDDTHFGICDYGGCAISQAVARGTMCKNGAITWAVRRKRHLAMHHRYARLHS